MVSSESHQIENTSEVIQCQSGVHVYSYNVANHQQHGRLLSHTVMVRDETPEPNCCKRLNSIACILAHNRFTITV